MSVNLEIHVGLWIPKSVPYTVMSASLRSRKVGSLLGPSCFSVTTTRTDRPSSNLWRPWTPVASWRMPRGRFLSHFDLGDQVALRRIPDPGNLMPAFLRMTLRPPSQPTRYR